MGIEIPGYLKPVASIVGCRWPECDEDALYTMGGHWENMAGTLDKIREGGDDVAKAMLCRIEGQTHDAFQDYWKGASKHLEELAELSKGIGYACRVMGVLIKAYKLFVIASLVELAVELAIAAATAVETLGASTAEAAGAEVVTRTMIQQAVKKLLKKIIKETAIEALEGLGKGLGTELAWEGAENALGLRHGIDWKKVGEAGEHQAISSAVNAESKKALKEVGVDAHHQSPHAKSPHDKDDHEDDSKDKKDADKDDTNDKDKEKEKKKQEKEKKEFGKNIDDIGEKVADQATDGPDSNKKRLLKDSIQLIQQSHQGGNQNPPANNPQNPSQPMSLNLPPI